MLALRYAAVLALTLWIGGLAAIGAFAAPAAFDVLGAGGSDGRAAAGAVVGEALTRFQAAIYVCSAVLVASLAIRAVLGPRPRRFAVRITLALTMAGAAAWSGLVLFPQIEQTRRAVGSPSALPEDDPRRAAFGRLHGLSTSLQVVPLLGGLVLLLYELRD